MLLVVGLVCGGLMENVIVLDEDGVVNLEGLCFDDEFVCYKVFDVLGDFYFVGVFILGCYFVSCFGYVINNEVLCVLLNDFIVWKMVFMWGGVVEEVVLVKF